MTFQQTYKQITTSLSSLRSQMNVSCNASMMTLFQAMLVECPTVTSVLWNQQVTTTGFNIGTIAYTTASQDVMALLKKDKPGKILPKLTPVTGGPTQLVEFAAFLHTIPYHLYCKYGQSLVVLAKSGVTVVPL